MSVIDILETLKQKEMESRDYFNLLVDLLKFYLGDLSDKKVLDVGCGTNRDGIWVSRQLAKFVGEMYGVDERFYSLQDGEMAVVDCVKVYRKDAIELPKIFPPDFFDGVISTSFLDSPDISILDQQKILESLYKVTRRNGIGIHLCGAIPYPRIENADLEKIGYNVLNIFHDAKYTSVEGRFVVFDMDPYEHSTFQRRLNKHRGDSHTMDTINHLLHTLILLKR